MPWLSYDDPWNALLQLQRNIDRAQDRPFGQGLSGRGAFPPVNVFRDEEGYVARFEVPGVASGDLNVEAQGRSLQVSGKRAPKEHAGGSVHRRECWSGEFSRSLQFPEDADTSRARAQCSNGILTVRVPQREEAKARRIAVNAS